MRKILAVGFTACLVALLACGGIPDLPLPCPPFCDLPPPEPGEAYDCENPPDLAGFFVRVENPILDEFLIVLKEPREISMASEAQALVTRVPQLVGADIFSNVGILAMKLDLTKTAVLSRILADPAVAFVQQVGTKHITTEWNLDRIDQRGEGLDGKYDPFSDGANVNIAIVDTGIAPHPDFENRLQPECFTAHMFGNCVDQNGHGTHVAATAAGREFGVAKHAKLYSVRVLDKDGRGSDTDVIRGNEWVVAQKKAQGGTWVINMSLSGSPAPALDAAVCRVIEAGITVVVAAGNDSADSYDSSPARVKQTICTGATERGDSTAYFSNHGPGVDVYAPGVNIRSAKPGGGSQTMQGTSMASPHVAGAVALMAIGKTPAEIEALIVETSTKDALSNVPSETANRFLYVGKGDVPPPPPPDPTACKLGTPKASEAVNPQYKIQRQSRMIVTGTPIADFGPEYYCTEEMNWPEACAAGQVRGPVAPDGHPQRLACEQHFNEQPCPTYAAYDADGHISFDPWFALGPDKINQNHPKNVAAGCGEQFVDHESWVKELHDGHWYVQSGMWNVATVHGNTKVMGCIANGLVCGVSKFRVDN